VLTGGECWGLLLTKLIDLVANGGKKKQGLAAAAVTSGKRVIASMRGERGGVVSGKPWRKPVTWERMGERGENGYRSIRPVR